MKYNFVVFEVKLRYSTEVLTLKQKFGLKLRKIRRTQNLTQEQLAELMSLSVEFISNMERGINAPSFQTLEQLSHVMHISIKEFFDFDE